MRGEELIQTEEGYTSKMYKTVEPYLRTYEKIDYFCGYDGTTISYRVYEKENSKGNILIVHGFSEFAQKYSEMIYILLVNNYTVYIPDLRGHGSSHRKLSNGCKVDVEDFHDYIADLHVLFVNKISKSKNNNYIFGHSMGGAIVARYMEEYPDDFKKAVLSSPMIQVKTGKIPLPVAYLIASFEKRLGKGTKYANGEGDFCPSDNFENSSCKSKNRYSYIMNMRRSNCKYQTWGADYNWLYAACKNTFFIRNKKNIQNITRPIIILYAENDNLINIGSIEKFAKMINATGCFFFENTRHEIFNGDKEARLRFYHTVFAFLESK